ncbi:uncharacterized protein LODBEIA_P41490 [Lodderomyces beijingensis]|uniref:DnaJ homologue subfamily C member 28 conserved domain-containing protein n=1 Tax=Lodderomyces beijingensis TaxID=1775926 RepID=A0ABP0ZP38_9ASCO
MPRGDKNQDTCAESGKSKLASIPQSNIATFPIFKSPPSLFKLAMLKSRSTQTSRLLRLPTRLWNRHQTTKPSGTTTTKNARACDDDEDVTSSSLTNEVNSAVVDRMKQILEEKITSQSSITDLRRSQDPGIQTILTKYDYGSQDSHTQAQSYIKSEPLLAHNKHARDIYNAKPWTGTESTHDANLRMLGDSAPPRHGPVGAVLRKRQVSPRERLSNARDGSLNYKLESNKSSREEDDKFREMYREKLLGPAVLLTPSTSIDFVNSLAGNRINAAINQQTGRFDHAEMESVRGKPLTQEHLNNCTDSNYFMNQILNKQEVLPPWIEAQQSIDRNVRQFRVAVDEMWFKWIVNSSVMKSVVDRAHVVDEILHFYEVNVARITFSDSNTLADSDLKYIEAKVKSLNDQVRHYNLQCPSLSGHKMKLDAAKEIRDSYWRSLEDFPERIEKWFQVNKMTRKSNLVDSSSSGASRMFKALSIKNGPEVHVNRDIDTRLHLWKAIKDIFKPQPHRRY